MTERGNLMMPLAAVTPPRHMAHLVASRSYLSYSKSELQDKLRHNPYSYIQIINPDARGDVQVHRVRLHVMKFGAATRNSRNKAGSSRPSNPRGASTASHQVQSWTGVVCNLELAQCANGGLKTYERPWPLVKPCLKPSSRRWAFTRSPFCACGPTMRHLPPRPTPWWQTLCAGTSHTDFMTADGIRHEIWRIPADGPMGKRMAQTWGAHPTLYLADGHHRLASSLRLAKARPDLEGSGHILAFVVPERNLSILGYHKEIRSMELSSEAFENALKCIQNCRVDALESSEGSPSKAGEVVVHHQGKSWRLTRGAQSPEATDADFVDVHLLRGVLDIHDARNDPRLRHLPEPSRPEHGWSSRAFEHPERVLILLHPIPFGHVRKVADDHNILPPKSTWVEPKIRSALFIHEFQPA